MGDVVNLRRARKARARAAAAASAAENRGRHGRSKVERVRGEADEERAARIHEGHRIED